MPLSMNRSPTKNLRWKAKLKKLPGLVPLVRLCKLIGNPQYRSEWRLKHNGPHNLFQPYGTTFVDRYPRIFTFVKDQLANATSPRLLSFGCSTGEEVFTLRRYFSNAEIVGIDINPRSIAHCRKQLLKQNDPRIRFELSNSPDTEPQAYYDAIFCMAVLRHGDLGASGAVNCEHLISFADFEKTVTALCRCLKPGGYLSIMHSNFRFSDTAVAQGFETVLRSEKRASRNDTPIYGADNHLLPNVVYHEMVFRKHASI